MTEPISGERLGRYRAEHQPAAPHQCSNHPTCVLMGLIRCVVDRETWPCNIAEWLATLDDERQRTRDLAMAHADSKSREVRLLAAFDRVKGERDAFYEMAQHIATDRDDALENLALCEAAAQEPPDEAD